MEIIVSGVDLWKLCCEDFMYSNLQKHHLKMPDLSSTYGTFILRLFVMVILSSSERTVLTMLVVWEQLLMGDFTCSYTDLLISTFNVFQTEHKQLQFNMHMLSTWPTMCSCAYSYSNLEPRLGQYQNSNPLGPVAQCLFQRTQRQPFSSVVGCTLKRKKKSLLSAGPEPGTSWSVVRRFNLLATKQPMVCSAE